MDDDLLLSSQEDKRMESSSTASLEETIKRTAISPASNEVKRPKLNAVDSLKLMIRRPDGDVDEHFFEKLSLELVSLQQQIPQDGSQPIFSGSGFVQGIGWFAATDDFSVRWLRSSLSAIKAKKAVPFFEILPYTKLPTLRRAIVSLPLVPRLNKNAHSIILNMISKLNPNLSTKYWKVSRILPPENGKQSVVLSIDENSVETIQNQKNKIHYSLSKVYVKIYPPQTIVN